MSAAVAKRYAHALFEVAKEHGKIEQVEKDIVTISQTVKEHQELNKVLKHPSVTTAEKKAIFESLLEKMSEEVRNFIFLLIDRQREMELAEVTKEYIELANDTRGVLNATVTTAKPLSSQEEQQLADRFGQLINKKLRVETKIDSDIIGGVVVKIGDRLYDGSIAGKLSRVQQHIKQSEVR